MVDVGAGPAAAKGEVRIEEPGRWERTVARRSAESRATVPDVELSAEVDVGAGLELAGDSSCGVTAMLVRACALALREVPRANASYRDGRFELYSRVNIGVTFAMDDAYVIPTVFDSDERSVGELSEELARLAARAAAGELAPPELSGATFTLANVGDLGVVGATPIIIPPQAGALAAGAVREVPTIRGGAIVPVRMMTLTLACDHRILYGARAAGLLMRIKSRLEDGSL